jgi:hypothetical protein
MKKDKKPLQVARETVRHLDSNTFLHAVVGQRELPLTSTVNTDPYGGDPSGGCCGCA